MTVCSLTREFGSCIQKFSLHLNPLKFNFMPRKNKWTPISFSIKILRKSKCQVSLAVKYSFTVFFN